MSLKTKEVYDVAPIEKDIILGKLSIYAKRKSSEKKRKK